MNFIKILAVLVVGYGLLLPVQGLANDLITGVWFGTYSKVDENDVVVVEYEVQKTSNDPASGEDYKITLYLYDEPFDFENLVVTNEKLNFSLNLGEPVTCLLTKEDGIFKGVCSQQSDDDLKPCFKLIMKPPTEDADR